MYIPNYAKLAARLQDKLQVPRGKGKKGSKEPITWTQEDQEAFEQLKKVMCEELILQRINPDKPFIIRADASKYAVGAVLEQMFDNERVPSKEDILEKRTVPVGFLSRKLVGSQRNWTPREQETYAILLALKKWQHVIGHQAVKVISDHKALENWATETLDTPSGPAGRRSRWHEFLSKFNLTVEYLPGKTNQVADSLSRWAYPASQAAGEATKHGSAKDKKAMEKEIQEEEEDERQCLMVEEQATSSNAPVAPPRVKFMFKHQREKLAK